LASITTSAPDRRARPATLHRQERNLEVDAEIQLAHAHVFLARLNHKGQEQHTFRRDRVYWIDLCLTPRRPNADARFCDHWSPPRYASLGSLIALPPHERLVIRTAGGRHVSLICQLQAQAVERWLPEGFVWTERRLEAVLNIANETIKSLMLRLNEELKRPSSSSIQLCDAIIAQLAIELARYFSAASATDTKGGLASWRLRTVEERIADASAIYPTAAELASLCRLSPRQFSRAFRVSRGCSIGDHLAQARIEAAKRRLFTKDSITQIARALGYSSQSSFSASFRRSTGTTPGQFRARTSVGRRI
jgi:AraC family transcriptional regulator